MKKILSFLLFSIISIYSNAYIVVDFSSFGNYDLNGKTFYIESGNPAIKSNDLEFHFYRDIFTQMLIRHKAIPTKDVRTADMCILLDYAITDRSYQAIVSKPVWGETGISSITTSTTTTENASGSANAYGYGNSVHANATTQGSSTTNTTQNIEYNHGITGYRHETQQVENYYRVINVYAYDNKNREGEPEMLWKINAESDGYKNDLSYVYPLMVEALYEYVGKSSNGRKEKKIDDDNFEALAMKEGKYLNDNTIINPINYNNTGYKGIELRRVVLDENNTQLIFLCKKGDIGSLKFTENTFVIYNGQRYKVQSITNSKNENMIDKKFGFSKDFKQISFSFPIKMNKGDKFDFVAYKTNKKGEIEEEILSLKDVILE